MFKVGFPEIRSLYWWGGEFHCVIIIVCKRSFNGGEHGGKSNVPKRATSVTRTPIFWRRFPTVSSMLTLPGTLH